MGKRGGNLLKWRKINKNHLRYTIRHTIGDQNVGKIISQFKGRGCLATVSTVALAMLLGACTPQPKAGAGVKTTAEPQVVATADAPTMPADADGQYEQAMAMKDTDPERAVALLERAALQGHGEAAYQLGMLQADARRRVEWHSMAAAVGQVDAQYALGEAYLYGRGTAKEPAWGLSWLERAARAGHTQAQYAMGMAFATGFAGSAMGEEALVWLLIAQQNGQSDAGLMISMLQARLSNSTRAAAAERAKAWVNEPAGDAESRATTRFAQYALGRLGFDAGLADGIRGDRTDQAVSAFRQGQGLRPGGLDGRTLDLLRERIAVLNR